MERKEYLESMGVRAARRAFFSYTTEPEGSYSIHRVFIRFLEVNRMDMGQAEEPKAAAFLTDYILLRIYVAKYVLAGYAETYAPLLDVFRGFEQVEKKFSLFMVRATAPGHDGKRRPAMARNESFCRLICRDAMMSAACGRLSNFLTVSYGGMKKGKTRRNGL